MIRAQDRPAPAPPSRRRSSPTRTSRSSSRPPTSGSRRARASASATSSSEGEKFSDLCTRAAEPALKRAHVKAEDLDMILVGTISGDMPFPATACLVQQQPRRHARGGLRRRAPPASASSTALHLADGLIQSRQGGERPRHRRRDPVALRGLDRPQHLRPLRRRRGRRRAPGDQGRPRHPRHAS